jgi:hypothetical protein
MTTSSEYCNNAEWSREALISKTKKRIEEVKKYYDVWFKVTTNTSFKPPKDLSKVTETFNHAFNDLNYKLERLKVILTLLENDQNLMQCILDKNTINDLIKKYNESMQSGTKSIKLYEQDSNARDFFKIAFKESSNEGYPNTIVEKTIKFHFEKLKGLINSIDTENLEESKKLGLRDVQKLIRPPELNLNSIDDKYVQRITSCINSMCTVVFMRNQSINETPVDYASESRCDTNKVLKDAKTILIPFLKYKSMTNANAAAVKKGGRKNKTGGRKNKTVARKIMRRRSCRKNQKLVV